MAEDIVHQYFLRLINHLDKINEVDCHKTRGFIVTIVENIAIDFYRKRKRENNISFDEIELTIYHKESEYQMGLNNIEMAISKLPISYLTVFKLEYTHGYNNKEIADILKISEDNVRQRI